jgi:hypothetical protein
MYDYQCMQHITKNDPQEMQHERDSHTSSIQKASFPLWVVFLFLFLVSLLLGLGVYIVLQKRAMETPVAVTTGSPEVFPSPSVSTAIAPGPDWKIYRDDKAGFMLQYPPTVKLDQQDLGDKDNEEDILSISVESIDSIPEDLPLGMGRASALADKAALEKGVAQTVGDFAASDALVRIGNMYNARMTSILSRFEICSVIFSRKIVFYPNNFRVMISLSGSEKTIIPSMPEFFTVDKTNCGSNTMWNRDRMGEFMPILAKGQGKGAGQAWYDTFSAIAKTITPIPVSQTSTPSPLKPTGSRTCEVSDPDFCTMIANIQTKMYASNYAGLLDFQKKTTVTCDPDGMAIAICEGAPKGAVKEGYAIGYNQSEGSVQEQYQYISTIQSYIRENGPFLYKGSLQSGDTGIIVYLSPDNTKIFVFPFTRQGSIWGFRYILIGQTFGESAYSKLSPSLLESVR